MVMGSVIRVLAGALLCLPLVFSRPIGKLGTVYNVALLGQLTASSNYDDVGEAIIKEGVRRGHSRAELIAETADGIQESGLKPGAKSSNGLWWGIYQQDSSYTNRDDPNANIRQFMDRLDAKRKSAGASSDPWLNVFWLQQRPGEPSAALAYTNGRKAYLTEIQSRTAAATALVDKYGGDAVADNRPDFNEFPIWSPNNQSRNGTKVDLFILHTQEGGGGDAAAESLANYLANPANQVSYHYTISQASDGGVTVIDCVDTDDASWSVLDANNRSINLCFAGSKASWTRADWMKQAKAIDVAAYLAVQDCKKSGIPTTVLGFGGGYTQGAGITDHRYVTDVLGVGSHTDVGSGFPKDFFAAAVVKYANGGAAPVVEVSPGSFVYPSQDVMLKQVWEQLLGPQGKGWPQLGKNAAGKDLTLVDAVAALKPAV